MLKTSPPRPPFAVCENVQKHFIFKVSLINVYVYCTVFKVHVHKKNWKKVKKRIFCTGPTIEQPSSEQKISCTGKTSPSNHPRTLSICTLWVPIHLCFNSQLGPLLSSLSDVCCLLLLSLTISTVSEIYFNKGSSWSLCHYIMDLSFLSWLLTHDDSSLPADLALGLFCQMWGGGGSYSYLDQVLMSGSLSWSLMTLYWQRTGVMKCLCPAICIMFL